MQNLQSFLRSNKKNISIVIMYKVEIEGNVYGQKILKNIYDDTVRTNFKRILDLFDKVKSEKAWAGMKPQGPALHHEHGYHLYK